MYLDGVSRLFTFLDERTQYINIHTVHKHTYADGVWTHARTTRRL